MQYNQFLLQNIFIGRRANDSFRVRSLKWSNFIQHTHTHTTHIGVTFNLDELLESGLCGNSNTTIKRENTSEKIHNKSWNIFVANYNPQGKKTHFRFFFFHNQSHTFRHAAEGYLQLRHTSAVRPVIVPALSPSMKNKFAKM